MTLTEIIEQLESCRYECKGGPLCLGLQRLLNLACRYECEAGPLELNSAWLALKEIASQQPPWIWDGRGGVNIGGIHLSAEEAVTFANTILDT